MKGKYRIIVENKKIRYDFEVKRNITIIKGDSATGKTTLADMIAEYEENGADMRQGMSYFAGAILESFIGRDEE